MRSGHRRGRAGSCAHGLRRAVAPVYTGGSISALRPVAAGATRVSFSALRGTMYRIAVDGDRTPFALAWRPSG
jgi:hypothetical protein